MRIVDGRVAAFASLFLLAAASVVMGAGCSGAAEDESAESAGSAQTAVPAYDAVIRNGTKVDTAAAPTARESSSTHLLGYIPRVTPAAGLKQLLSVARWSDIRDAEGGQPFTHAQVVSDTGTAASAGDGGAATTRKVVVKLTLDGGVDLDVKATVSAQDGALAVRLVNTTGYSHWLVGEILAPEKLSMELKLVPYKDGLIVDATTRVKLSQMEDRAPKLTASITAIFDWLKRTTR